MVRTKEVEDWIRCLTRRAIAMPRKAKRTFSRDPIFKDRGLNDCLNGTLRLYTAIHC